MDDIKLGMWVKTPENFMGVVIHIPEADHPSTVVVCRCLPNATQDCDVDPRLLIRLSDEEKRNANMEASLSDVPGMDPITEKSPVNKFIDESAHRKQLELLGRHMGIRKKCYILLKPVMEQAATIGIHGLTYGTDLHPLIDSVAAAAASLVEWQKELRQLEKAADTLRGYRTRYAVALAEAFQRQLGSERAGWGRFTRNGQILDVMGEPIHG